MKLTFGLAVYDDPRGAWMTVQSALMHGGIMHRDDAEIIVVDNNPTSKHGKALAERMNMARKRVRYITMPEPVGTSAPRQRIFEEARGDYVFVADAHVLLDVGALQAAEQYLDDNPDCMDLIGGVMVRDDGGVTTHQENHWGDPFKTKKTPSWGAWGHDPRGEDPTEAPFEVWGNGLWLFGCRREAWVGFNSKLKGYGAEEGCLHEKFRKAGRRVLCMPALRAAHCFIRPVEQRYINDRLVRLRNYVIWFLELERPLSELYHLFVASKLVTPDQWQAICAEVQGKPRPAPVVKPKRKRPKYNAKSPGFGPGTELMAMYALLDVPSCQQCKDLAAQMDVWGPDGCRQHRGEILVDIRMRAKKMKALQTMFAGAKALAHWRDFRLSIMDPHGSMVDEAIRLAEEKQTHAVMSCRPDQ